MPLADKTPLDMDEAEALIPTWIHTRADLNEAEESNILGAIDWLARVSPDLGTVLSVDWLIELHHRMFSEVWRWAGATRVTGKNLGVEVWEIRPNLEALTADARHWFTGLADPIPDMAKFHHRLVTIHAFPNGNGRHARLGVDALAVSVGAKPPSWSNRELTPAGDRRSVYIESLKAADVGKYELLESFMRN